METPKRPESQQTFISLLQLDPLPMETPSPLRDDRDPPEALESPVKGGSTTGAPGLSGNGGHGAMYYRTS